MLNSVGFVFLFFVVWRRMLYIYQERSVCALMMAFDRASRLNDTRFIVIFACCPFCSPFTGDGSSSSPDEAFVTRWIIVTDKRMLHAQEEPGWGADKEKVKTLDLARCVCVVCRVSCVECRTYVVVVTICLQTSAAYVRPACE